MMPRKAITDYWYANYADGFCTLCGNWGVIDSTREAITPAGLRVGRLNFCICPTGQKLREHGADATRVLKPKGVYR